MKEKRKKIIIEGTIGNIQADYFESLYGKELDKLEIIVDDCESLPLKKIKLKIMEE